MNNKCRKMDYLTPESDTSTIQDLPSWTQLIPQTEKQRPSILKIVDDSKSKDVKEEEERLNIANIDDKSNPPRVRRESLMGTFHRHLRQSLKAVSEPGPLARYYK